MLTVKKFCKPITSVVFNASSCICETLNFFVAWACFFERMELKRVLQSEDFGVERVARSKCGYFMVDGCLLGIYFYRNSV